MSYRSDTAYAIVFNTPEDKQKIIDKLTPEQWNLIVGELTILPDRILYHDPLKSWRGGSLGYADVDAHQALISAAQDAWDETLYGDNSEGVPNMGIFIRLGEDSTDFERDAWGEDALTAEDAPEWFDLVEERREIVTGWEA